MEIEIAAGEGKINWRPESVKTEIIQNISMILASVQYSCPMDRDFALNGTVIDRPINLVPGILKARIIAAIRKYEPRVKVKSVSFTGNNIMNGILNPTVKVVLPDEKI